MDHYKDLCETARDLGDDELRVLVLIAKRLQMGAKQYGILNVACDPRDWAKEAGEEFLDATVYLAAAAIAGER